MSADESSSAKLRAAVDSLRDRNDRLAESLGIDPAEDRARAAEQEVLRLARRYARSGDARARDELLKASLELGHADSNMENSKR